MVNIQARHLLMSARCPDDVAPCKPTWRHPVETRTMRLVHEYIYISLFSSFFHSFPRRTLPVLLFNALCWTSIVSLMYNPKGCFLVDTLGARNYAGRVNEKGELKGCKFIGQREIRLKGFCLVLLGKIVVEILNIKFLNFVKNFAWNSLEVFFWSLRWN